MAIHQNDHQRGEPRLHAPMRPSPSVFFWVVGPILLIVLGMFSSSPQCVLNPQLSCSQNWHVADDGTLTVWLINSLWLKCARLTILAALSVVLSALVYHITLALKGVTPITHFVFMGAICAIFIPPTLFLMFSKFLNRNLMSEAAPPIMAQDGKKYHLFTHGPTGAESYILAEEKSRAFVAIRAKILATTPRDPSRTLGQLAVFPRKLEQAVAQSGERGAFTNSQNGSWLFGAVLPQYIIYAVNVNTHQVLSGSMLSDLSPFALVGPTDEISDDAQQRFLKAAYEQQLNIAPLWQEINNPNQQVRVVLARLLPLMDRDRSEAIALAEKLRQLDSSDEVKQELSQFLATTSKSTEALPPKNILDLDPANVPPSIVPGLGPVQSSD